MSYDGQFQSHAETTNVVLSLILSFDFHHRILEVRS